MTVGLLSMQRVNNYGSFWQAYCLKALIEQIAGTVEFIDIIPGDKETVVDYKRHFSISKIKRIPYYIFQQKKNKMFERFQETYLGCKREMNYKDNYDAIIIGSDEVFNCTQQSPWGYSSQLFGNINNDNVHSYAASFGYTTFSGLKKTGLDERIKNDISNLKSISVRDNNSATIITAIAQIGPKIHWDPVLLGNLSPSPCKEKKPFILVYSYDFRFNDEALISQIKDLAKKENCRILSVGFYQEWCDKCVAPDPFSLLGYFQSAKYVITDTFHGTVFSIRFHKQFVSVVRDTNSQKLSDLLESVELSSRIICQEDDLLSFLKKPIDYSNFEEKRLKQLDITNAYLKNCI